MGIIKDADLSALHHDQRVLLGFKVCQAFFFGDNNIYLTADQAFQSFGARENDFPIEMSLLRAVFADCRRDKRGK